MHTAAINYLCCRLWKQKKWKDALGGQYGCLYIDEVNTADIDFVRESSMRCDYLMATLNPDDPTLPVYKEYINCSRPLPEWEQDTPQEIKNELKEEPKPGWVHWFFSFDDNAGLPEEKKRQIIQNTPKGTKIWKIRFKVCEEKQPVWYSAISIGAIM